MEKIEKIEKIKPSGIFTNYIFKAIPLAFDESLSYYEMLCGLLKKVKTIEEVVNNHADIIKELEEFVAHYFDNLDVQEEINNKLDEMAENGELAEIINEQIFNQLNEEVKNNKEYELSDTVQGRLYKKLNNLFTVGWSISSIIIKSINNNKKGIAVACDWTEGGSEGTKFNIVTFNYDDDTVTNIVTRVSLLDGHANSMCDIGNNKILICANGYYYIYDLVNNNYTNVSGDLPYFSAVGNDSKGNIYASQPYDPISGDAIDRLYILNVDNENDTVSISETKTLPNYSNKLGGNSQGMVIYNDLIIFPSFAPCKLCIYDLNTLKYLKTQLFTAPYITEYEDGFIYDNKLLLVDSNGQLIEPDIYDKNCIGDYLDNSIMKSLTDIALVDEPIKLAPDELKEINFSEYMYFGNSNSNNNIGTIGSQLESITIYLALRTSTNSEGLHTLKPIELPMFKKISYNNDTINWYTLHWDSSYTELTETNVNKKTIAGYVTFGGGTSIPTIKIKVSDFLLSEYWPLSSTTYSYEYYDIDTSPFDLYITKIIGHRKVGTKY